MRWLLRVFSGLCALAFVLSAFVAADDWRFWKRYADQMMRGGADVPGFYDTRVKLAGGNGPPLPQAAPDALAIPQPVLDKLADYAGARKSTALLVWYKGQLQLARYWGGDREAWLNSKSFAKMALGLLVGRAIQDGLIQGTEQKAADFLPEWQGDADGPGDRRQISIADLLHMESGLERYVFSLSPFAASQRCYLGSDNTACVLKLKRVEPPGQVYDYSNWTSIILGIVVERAAQKRWPGIDYETYLSQALWKPLGLADASMWADHPGGLTDPACCTLARAEDWMKLALFTMRGGVTEDGTRLIPEAYMKAARAGVPDKPKFGYHLWLGYPYEASWSYAGRHITVPPDRQEHQSEPYLASDTILFDGANHQKAYIVPSRDLVVLRMGADVRDWDDAVLPNKVLRALK